ncbi:MAG: hypothetical protein NVSMB21_05870 [Vulcanimicrobiaceae bacterium]
MTGPVGAGKTTAIATYLATRPGRCVYLAMRGDEGLDAFRERLSSALGIAYRPASFVAFLAAIATRAPCEIALDDIDRATAETLEELGELVREAPLGVAFIFAARDREAVDVRRYLARGLGAMLEAPALAFDPGDIARLAELHRLAYAPADIERFLEETEGWPLVATWAMREAAAELGATLAGAYDRWRRTNGRHFREFVDDELVAAGEPYRDAFRSAMRGTGLPDERERLALLEARGLFVYYADETYRPYRVARQFDVDARPSAPAPPNANATATATATASLLVVRMFGRFEAEIGGRRIEWIRKREAQIFKYLLLKPSGAASRAELLETFWGHADGHLATQSLRTASSNIRKALAALVGYASVERYFSTRGDMAVALDRAVIDVRRFSAHVADGDTERERGRAAEAFAHYRAAESIYGGELLGGEYPEPWYLARAAMYRALYLGVLERIAEHHADAGHARQAREYATRIAELRAG